MYSLVGWCCLGLIGRTGGQTKKLLWICGCGKDLDGDILDGGVLSFGTSGVTLYVGCCVECCISKYVNVNSKFVIGRKISKFIFLKVTYIFESYWFEISKVSCDVFKFDPMWKTIHNIVAIYYIIIGKRISSGYQEVWAFKL